MYSPSLHRTPSVRDYLAGAWRHLRSAGSDESAFTLSELLVVCLIVGILAAIAIPSFASQQGKAVDAQAKALARTAQTAAETVAAENSGNYEKVSAAELNRVEPAIRIVASAGNAYLSAATAAQSEYSVTAKGTSGDELTISRDALGEVSRKCVSPVTKTGCGGAAAGSW
jgi:type IV pilus assembly protein PilA